MSTETRLLAVLAKEIVKAREQHDFFLTAGRAADYADYRYICGVIRGLTTAEEFINDLVQRMENDDE